MTGDVVRATSGAVRGVCLDPEGVGIWRCRGASPVVVVCRACRRLSSPPVPPRPPLGPLRAPCLRVWKLLERTTGFEPATLTLAR
jgi:hypothetical protein